jgi:hypothetical protein
MTQIEVKNFHPNNEIVEINNNQNKVKTFNNKFNYLQADIIKLCRSDSRACTDYAYLYLRLLEKYGIITINNLPDKIISTESPARLLRKLKENCFDNPDLAFLRRYCNNQDNEDLFEESKLYYRSN